MDDAYARKKLEEIYSKISIPTPSIYQDDAAELIRSELSRLIEANSILKYEFGVRSKLKPENTSMSFSQDSAFYNVKAIMEEPTLPHSSDMRLYPRTLRDDLLVVVRKLLLCLPPFESTSSPRSTKSGRPLEAKYNVKDRIITIGKKAEPHYQIQQNSKSARLCEKVLISRVQVGDRLGWKKLYEYVYEDQSNSLLDWTKIDQLVRVVNTGLKKKKMTKVLKYEGGKEGYVERIR